VLGAVFAPGAAGAEAGDSRAASCPSLTTQCVVLIAASAACEGPCSLPACITLPAPPSPSPPPLVPSSLEGWALREGSDEEVGFEVWVGVGVGVDEGAERSTAAASSGILLKPRWVASAARRAALSRSMGYCKSTCSNGYVQGWPEPYINRYVRCTYDIFSREITIYTVIYGAEIRFWTTLDMCLPV